MKLEQSSVDLFFGNFVHDILGFSHGSRGMGRHCFECMNTSTHIPLFIIHMAYTYGTEAPGYYFSLVNYGILIDFMMCCCEPFETTACASLNIC